MSIKSQYDFPLKIGKGVTSPSFSDHILENGKEIDLTGATVKFQLRDTSKNTLKIDTAGTVENQTTDKGGVRYDWTSTDLDTPGEYSAWWHVTLASSKILKTDPIILIVDDHLSSGLGVTTGEIYQRIKGHIPNTINALSRDPRYGDIKIQQKIDLSKFRLFSTSVSAQYEATTYNPLVLDFLAKKSTIEIIPSAVDFWMDSPQVVNTTGTDEVVSYPDRIDALWRIYERLSIEVEKLEAEVLSDIPTTIRRGIPAATDTRSEDMITSDPQDWGRQFADPLNRSRLPWDS